MKTIKLLFGYSLVKSKELQMMELQIQTLQSNIHTLVMEPNTDKARIVAMTYSLDYKLAKTAFNSIAMKDAKPVGIVNQLGVTPNKLTANISITPECSNILNQIDLNNLCEEENE